MLFTFLFYKYVYLDVVNSVAFSSDGKYLATGSEDYTVNFIEVESKTIMHKFENIHSGNNNKFNI